MLSGDGEVQLVSGWVLPTVQDGIADWDGLVVQVSIDGGSTILAGGSLRPVEMLEGW